MKKFLVRCRCEKYIAWEVKANNEEEALELAADMSEDECCDFEESNINWTTTLIEDGVDEEQVREDFKDWLDSLLHKRFSYEKLTELIREKTGIADLAVCMDIGDDDGTDYHAIFDIQGEHDDHPLAGEFDIYYLKMREDACEMWGHEERINITEVNASYYN
jgi:hypothetical protein